MDEFSFIDSIKQSNYRQSTVLKGIGDDGAVYKTNSLDQVISVDTFVEGVHFNEQTMGPIDVGYRALAANLSDLAAMGATPNFYLVSIVIPKDMDLSYIQKIFDGMEQLARAYRIDLIGGDTVAGTELTLSITVIGSVLKNRARYRHNAQVNDVIFVTGTLGDSACGLDILLKTNTNYKENMNYFIQRHRRPTPRVTFGERLSSINRIALNDISDGLANELGEIATSSNVQMNVDASLIPLHPFMKQFSNSQKKKWSLFGGEDFELVGTVSRNDWPIVQQIAEESSVLVTEIGFVSHQKNNEHNVWLLDNGDYKPLYKKGYVHLK